MTEHASEHDAEHRSRQRKCPWCHSRDVLFTQRGFTGPTDAPDQYITCNNCKRLTYEIISRNTRDMRMGQYQAGGIYRDTRRQTKYDITRVLKVGSNEYLLYVKPILRDTDPMRSTHLRRGRF